LRILLDECVPRGLKKSFRQFELILTVPDAGLAGYKNGHLLKRIEGRFDVFITVDKSIEYQQELGKHDVAFVLLRARSSDIADIQPLVAKLLLRWAEVERRKLLVVE